MSEAGNTRQRIQQVAVELFTEQGYDATSLRQIAERLGLTKAALYYHFRTKEDIAVSFFEDYGHAVEDLTEWGESRPNSIDTKRELLARYADLLVAHMPAMRFMHENRPALRKFNKEQLFQERMGRLIRILASDEDTLLRRLRAFDAIMTMHGAWFLRTSMADDPAEIREATLAISIELIESNERDRRPSAAPTSP